MKKLLLLVVLIIAVAGCNRNGSAKNSLNNDSLNTFRQNGSVESAGKTVLDFLNWYKTENGKLEEISMVNNTPAGKGYDPKKYYSVNFNATEKYLSNLKKCGFVSEIFINKLRTDFKSYDEYFKKNPENDGPPYGFDQDIVLSTQEPELVSEAAEKHNLTYKSVSAAVVEVILPVDKNWSYKFVLSFEKEHWLIDSIDYVK